MAKKIVEIAMVGQPNCGKTSLFNKLTGSSQQVGNWAGVTVEKKEGKLVLGNKKFNVVDLPGIYSLSAFSMEEKVTRSYLLDEKPDLIINVIDATNLERQLFLTVQLLFIGIPTILVLNMMDEVAEKGYSIDTKRFSELLGVPVLETVARDSKGVNELKEKIEIEINNPCVYNSYYILENKTGVIESIKNLSNILLNINELKEFKNWYALKFLENDPETVEIIKKYTKREFGEFIIIRRELATKLSKHDFSSMITDWIYGITRGIETEVLKGFKREKSSKEIISNFLDMIVLNKFTGVPVFFLVMFLLFQATFFLGEFVVGFLEQGIGIVAGFVDRIGNPLLVSLLKDGIIGGVGNVLLLIPYIFIMFLLMSFLEDTGYMARAAFVMDRFMHSLGLHGKSFIPLVMGFGCNVPAIMAARTLETHEERIKTILMIPFIACSARLPVFVLFSGALFGKNGGIAVFALYLLGIIISIITGLLLNKTFLKKKSEGLIMELPPYRVPRIINSVIGTWPKVKSYFFKAGTLIFAASVILWILSYFPYGVEFGGEKSLIGYLGKAVGFILFPLGFDWKMSIGLVSGFVAKEVIISTLSVLYSGGAGLSAVLPTVINPVVGFSYLAFILIYTPCLATIAVIKTETNSIKWTVFSIVYSIAFAYVVSLLITTFGRLIFNL
jgi:ferrous iron transport protein B